MVLQGKLVVEMGKKLYIILLVLVLLLNVFLCYQLFRMKQIRAINTPKDELINELKSDLAHSIDNSGLVVNPLIPISLENDTTIKTLNDLIYQPILFYFYNNLSCEPCTDSEIVRLDSLVKAINTQNIYIITKNSSIKSLYLLKRANSFKMRVVLISDDFNIPISNFPLNYYFILDRDFYIKYFYIPSRKNRDLYNYYFQRISDQFKII